jgi:hypothetical protein
MADVTQLCNAREAVESQIRRAVAANNLERQVRLLVQAAQLEADLSAWAIDLAGW